MAACKTVQIRKRQISSYCFQNLELFDSSWFGSSAGRIWLWVDQDATVPDEDVESGHLLDERRRRQASLGDVLIAVPWTSDAAKNNFAFAQGPVLVLANVGNSRDLSFIFEDGDPFAREANDSSAVFRNVGYGAGVDEAVVRLRSVV